MYIVQSAAPTYISELSPGNKGTVAVLYQTFFYFGGCMGTWLPSIMWEHYKYTGVVALCIGLILLGSFSLGCKILINKQEHSTFYK